MIESKAAAKKRRRERALLRKNARVRRRRAPGPKLVAVLDSNLLLELFSWHDMVNAYNKAGTAADHDPEATYRRHRARDALSLALHLHAIGANTYCLRSEVARLHTKRVPPNSPPNDVKLHYVIVFRDFVKAELLPRWIVSSEPEKSLDVQGKHADAYLVNRAKAFNVPFITSEGFLTDGRVEEIRARAVATAAGVPVYTPGEFCDERGVDRSRLFEAFIQRFETRMPDFVRRQRHPAVTKDTLEWVHGYYRHVFRGECRHGLTVPVSVTKE